MVQTPSRRHLSAALVALASLSMLAAAACGGGEPEVRDGGGEAGVGNSSGGDGGRDGGGGTGNVLNLAGNGTGAGNGTAGDGTGGSSSAACQAAGCTPGQRCEFDGGTASCVDNTCADIGCGPTERCDDHPDGGKVCTDISCSSDVSCATDEFCDPDDGICAADVCTPGARTCDGAALSECTPNGGEAPSKFTCGETGSYFSVACVDGGDGEAGCSCEGDWDCPAFTECEAGTCAGTGVEPTCTLPPTPFEDTPPAVEIFWGGESRRDGNGDAFDGTRSTPAPWPTYSDVLNTPVVANLDDDNGDGLINELDFPEIIFASHADRQSPWSNAVVRAIHGGGPNKGKDFFAVCGDTTWKEGDAAPSTACTNAIADADAGAAVAVGDLDGDGVPEIVVPTEDQRLRILSATGDLIYVLPNTASLKIGGADGPTPTIANLDFAGLPEIIFGNKVYVLEVPDGGTLQVSHVLTGTFEDSVTNTEADGRNEGNFGRMTCAADLISASGGMEIVVGPTLYRLPDTLPTCGTAPCTGDLVKIWHAPEETVNATGDRGASFRVGTDELVGFCSVADVWGADSDEANPPHPTKNPLDGVPEVVYIANGHLMIVRASDGYVIQDRDLGGGVRGGAPNIDDFDGDGFPEVASALRDFYIVEDLQPPQDGADPVCGAWTQTLPRDPDGANPNDARAPGGTCTTDADCGGVQYQDGSAAAVCNTTLGQCVCLHNGWQRASDDSSSRMTSSSVFDFNGDGAAEVVYNDECDLRVYDGLSGEVYFAAPNRSRTGIENPVVADVDNDGNAEIVAGANTTSGDRCDEDGGGGNDPTSGPNGLRVWGDPTDTWVSARRIWNQQSYHVVNVTEGGAIPAHAPESWGSFAGRTYNTYRSQPRSFGVAPDLAVVEVGISSPDAACGTLGSQIDIAFKIENQGDLRVGPGVVIAFEGTWGTETERLRADGGTDPLLVTLEASLEPRASIILSVRYDQANNGQGLPDQVEVIVDPDDLERECEDGNNSAAADVDAGTERPELLVSVDAVTAACPNVEVATTVTNAGTAPLDGTVVHYFAGDPSQGGTRIHSETVSGPISAGDSTTFQATIPSFPENRSITVWAVVDPEDTVDECNEANNSDPADNAVACTSQIQ